MHATLALLALLAPATAPSAPPEPLPEAKAVLERYVEVTGGRAAYERTRHRTLTGTLELTGPGMSGRLWLHQSAPDRMLLKIDLPRVGTLVRATDGTHAWELSAATGPRLLHGAEKAETLLEAAFHAELRPEEIYAKMQTVGIAEVDGRPAYALELTPRAGGGPRTYYYDRASGLLLKFVGTATTPSGEVQAVSTLSDYRRVGGIVVPHRLTLSALGQEQVMTFDTFSTGPVPDSVYAMPPEVAALLAK